MVTLKMNYLYSVVLILSSISYAVSQVVPNNIPNVVLYGEPRVIARRIINADMKTARQLALPDDNQHIRYRVNVLDREKLPPVENTYMTEQRTPITVYRRILRPARIQFTGEGVVTDHWQGTSDPVELESWTLNRRPTVDGSFVQNPTQFH